MKLSAAIFDMDGLMFDTERLFLDSFREAVEPETGRSFPEEKLKLLIGKNRKDSESLFPTLFGTELSCEACYAIADRWREDYAAHNPVPVKKGLFPLLDALKHMGVSMAVASSTDQRRVEQYLRDSGTLPYFSAVIGGDKVTRGKPDPQIFLMAAEALSAAPEACVVFEDSINGLLAGHRAGMRVVIVPDLLDPTAAHPGLCDLKAETLDQAIPTLRLWRGLCEKV